MSCFDSIISFESDIFQTSSYLICSWADEDKRRGVELVWEVLFEYGTIDNALSLGNQSNTRGYYLSFRYKTRSDGAI